MYVFVFQGMKHVLSETAPEISELPRGWPNLNLKKKVLDYMASSNHSRAANLGRGTTDLFNGLEIPVCGCSWKDSAGWIWTDENIYYIDCYDILVPDDFIKHIEQEYADGFKPKNVKFPWRTEADLPEILVKFFNAKKGKSELSTTWTAKRS